LSYLFSYTCFVFLLRQTACYTVFEFVSQEPENNIIHISLFLLKKQPKRKRLSKKKTACPWVTHPHGGNFLKKVSSKTSLTATPNST